MNRTTAVIPRQPGANRARRVGRGVRLVLCWCVALFAMLVPAAAAAAPNAPSRLLLAEIDGAITPVMADHVGDAVERAERGYLGLILQIDTPGGLESSMREIVQDILDADVPVIVHVAPPGARAASAGAIITFAAHIAAMAPGTAIGAATPVGGGGEDLEAKATNDAAAYAASLAELRGRNVDFAVAAVREARSISAEEASRIGAIDFVADSTDQLLSMVDGRSVTVGNRTVMLDTSGARVESFDMGVLRRVQQFLADPNLAFLFLTLATLGLVFEFSAPGLGAGAIVAMVCFVLAFMGLAVLPVNIVGVVFMFLGALLLIAELFAPGFGVAAAGGLVMFILGGVFLVDDAPGLESSLAAVLPVSITAAVLCVIAGHLAYRSRRTASTHSGIETLVGRTVVVRRTGAIAQARVDGSWWRLRTEDAEQLDDGAEAVVESVDGLELVVRRAPAAPAADEPQPPERSEEHP